MYLNIESSVSFSSLNMLWNKIKSDHNPYNITRKQVNLFLLSFPSYSSQHEMIKKFPRFSSVMSDIHTHYQIDLMQMDKYSNENNSVKYILLCLDEVSKMLYGIHLANKQAKSCIAGMKIILKKIKKSVGKKIETIYCDRSGEFQSKAFTNFLSKNNIRQYSLMTLQ